MAELINFASEVDEETLNQAQLRQILNVKGQ